MSSIPESINSAGSSYAARAYASTEARAATAGMLGEAAGGRVVVGCAAAYWAAAAVGCAAAYWAAAARCAAAWQTIGWLGV